jgi:hypothetical protein
MANKLITVDEVAAGITSAFDQLCDKYKLGGFPASSLKDRLKERVGE